MRAAQDRGSPSRIAPSQPHGRRNERTLRRARSPGSAPTCAADDEGSADTDPFVRGIRLAWWSTGPGCGPADDSSAPCWSVYGEDRLTGGGRRAETDLRHEPEPGRLHRRARRRHRLERAERRAVPVVVRPGGCDGPGVVRAQAVGDDELPLARRWRDMPKVVFSSTTSTVDWNTRLVTGDAVTEITRLKAEDGGPMDIGGATLAAAAMRAGLIDEYVLATAPVLVGSGTPFFTALDNWVNLNLVETRAFPDGVVLTRYETKR